MVSTSPRLVILKPLMRWLQGGGSTRGRSILRGVGLMLLGCLVIISPFVWLSAMPTIVGVILLLEGAIEGVASLRAQRLDAGGAQSRTGAVSAVVSLLAGVICLAFGSLIVGIAVIAVGLLILADGVQRLWHAAQSIGTPGWVARSVGAGLLIPFGLAVLAGWPFSGAVSVGLALGARLFAHGWAALASPSSDGPSVEDYGVPQGHRFGTWMLDVVRAREHARSAIDRHWVLVLLLIFFAIHLGRMQSSWTFVGLLSPLVATLGDAVAAAIIGLALLLPLGSAIRSTLIPLERRCWRRSVAWEPSLPERPRDRVIALWLGQRVRQRVRLGAAASSPRGAFAYGLRSGLPTVAVVIATHPMWGFSWYFNSENWVTAVWERVTELRVDTWREAMTAATEERSGGMVGGGVDDSFAIRLPGTEGDFSFIVIGDPGEGDASQLILKDRVNALGAREDVRFLVISSDVVYPAGEMKDYEANFFLAFKGFTKPIVAIPGNHDWYDALDAFSAVFYPPEAARAALTARREADLGLTSTTAARAESLIAEAERLRRAYAIDTAHQRAPYFELQTERFALIAIDTGILRSLDPRQWAWLERSLERARGKFLMALVGHPIFAAGSLQATEGDFARLRELLRAHDARIVMGGDTHDFELYREPGVAPDDQPTLHVVNGGGGAYLSIGTALMDPARAVLADWACYPSREALVAKLDAQTPAWKWPVWKWTRDWGAWPSTAETLSAAFDFNGAPFFQSFVEIRVEPSRNRVTLIPHGAEGPLRWEEMGHFGSIMPSDAEPGSVVSIELPW
jgi:uncharacterized membrane protein HdeD (DUF308 family)